MTCLNENYGFEDAYRCMIVILYLGLQNSCIHSFFVCAIFFPDEDEDDDDDEDFEDDDEWDD